MAKEPKINPKSLPPMWRIEYGCAWPPVCPKGNPLFACPQWRVEREMLKSIIEGKEPKGSLGFAEHFMRMTSEMFGRQDWDHRFIWTPYAKKMLEAAIRHKFLGIAGHASSGKSVFGVVWGLGNWMLNPMLTKVFITSTSLTDSRQRIWGVVERYWHELERFFGGEANLPGKLISSRGIIKGSMDGEITELAGLALIAGEKSHERESVSKIGFKAPKVILIGDEMPMLSEGLYNAAKGNLFSNPDFSMIGIGNPASYFDAFGTFVEPKDGWESINEDMDGWETKLGYCLKFDGEKSPNVLAGREIYPGLLTLEKVRFYQDSLGRDSSDYWRMVRGFFSPTGQISSIYSQQEFFKYQCDHKVTSWVEKPRKIASIDLAWTHDGDRVVVQVGNIGTAYLPDGKSQKVLELVETIIITDDARAKEDDRNEQTLKQFIAICKERGIGPNDTAFDATGGGVMFGTLLKRDFGVGALEVTFGGAASDMQVSKNDTKTGKERYSNKVTELWFSSKELMRTGQIKGLNAATMKELSSRTYTSVGDRVKAESKKEMKARTGMSPDIGDSFNILVHLAKTRHSLSSTEKPAPKKRAPSESLDPFLVNLYPQKKKQPLFADVPEPIGIMEAGWGD